MTRLFFIFLLSGGTVHAQWTMINTPTSQNLTSIHFPDQKNGIAGGENGTIISSVDSGDTWIQQNSPAKSSVHSIFFLDASTGWVGDDSGLYFTADSCTSWDTIGLPYTISVRGIRFFNPNEGVICGVERINPQGGSHGWIMKTYDAGDNWVTLWDSGFYFANSQGTLEVSYEYYDMHYEDMNTGWVSGSYHNNFQTPEPQPYVKFNDSIFDTDERSPSSLGPGMDGSVTGIQFFDDFTGVACSRDGRVFKSTNSGTDWELIFNSDQENLALHFPSITVGYMVANRDSLQIPTLYRMNNPFVQLESISPDTHAFRFSDLWFTDLRTGFITAENGKIFKMNAQMWPVGNKESVSENRLNVWPNPCHGSVSLKYGKNINSYRLYDLKGKSVASGKLTGKEEEISIPDKGVFILLLSSDAGEYISKKIICY